MWQVTSDPAATTAMDQEETYTLFCFVLGEDTSFPVEVAKRETVGNLRDKIKEKKKNRLLNIDVDELKLYRVPVTGEDKLATLPLETLGTPLKTKDVLSSIFSNTPDGETIIVRPPEESSGDELCIVNAGVKRKFEVDDKSQDQDQDQVNVPPQLIFKAESQGEFSLRLNDIRKATQARAPDFVKKIADDLGKTRDVMNKAPTVQLDLGVENVQDAKATFTDNSTGLLTGQESKEFIHYQTVLQLDSLLPGYFASKDHFFYYRFLFEVEQYISKVEDFEGMTFERGKSWGFPLVAQIVPDGRHFLIAGVEPVDEPPLVAVTQPVRRFCYTPKSDWQLKLDGIPCLYIEVTSDSILKRDQDRMLIQASCLVRTINSAQDSAINAAQDSTNKSKSGFVDVCIYIDNLLSASRYLVYQPNAGDIKIEYTVRKFDLTKACDRIQFLNELYNFPSVAQTWNFETILDSDIFKKADELKFPGFTNIPTRTSKRPKTEAAQSRRSRNQASTPGGIYDNPSVEERLSQSGYHLLKEIDMPGWKSLNPLKSTLCKAKGSDGKLVMLKLVERDSDEVALHKMLDAIKSQFNHTIPFLDEVVFEFGTVIAVPYAIVLPLVTNAMLIKYCHDFARQFLEGVAFMHQQFVAHLDLKPDNLVVAEIQTSPRILIIDYGTSVQVHSREDVITGYRGTAGWVAPEVGWHDAPDQVFSPINADLWACGKMVKWFCSYLQRSCAQETLYLTQLATELMDEEPQKRPLLTLPLQLQLQLQPVKRGVKRKLETLDNRRKQRIRIHSDRQYAV